MRLKLLSVFLFTASFALAATQGTFTGNIISGPETGKDWIYVQGSHGTVRRVEVSHAAIRYSSAVPSRDRAGQAKNSLREGARVRVTAAQDDAGEWKASSIMILAVPAKDKPTARQAAFSIAFDGAWDVFQINASSENTPAPKRTMMTATNRKVNGSAA